MAGLPEKSAFPHKKDEQENLWYNYKKRGFEQYRNCF